MDTLWKDVRFAVRMLLRSRSASGVCVLALGLGIGCNVACFITVNAMVLHPLAYPRLERLLTLWETTPTAPGELDSVAPANFLDWKARSSAFESMAAYHLWDAPLTGSGDPERIQACVASAEFFDVLGLDPLMGRVFTAEEAEPGRDGVAVVSQGFWKSHLASTQDAVGRTIALSGRPYRIVGVMPAELDYPLATDVWIPLAMTPEERGRRGARNLAVLGRLKPTATLAQARAELDGIARQLAREYPNTNQDRVVAAVPILERMNPVTKRFSAMLLGAAGFVLLLACANVGNLQLSRATARRKMIAVQAALGASRFRLARQLTLEGLLLALAGGALGLWLANWNADLMRTVLIPRNVLRYVAGVQYIRVDGWVLLFTLAASALAGLISGFPAAYHLLRRREAESLSGTLKEGGRTSGAAASRSWLRSGLVVSEVALALILLVGAALMANAFHRMTTLSVGYDTSRLLTMKTTLPEAKYRGDARKAAFWDQTLAAIGEIPDVRLAGASGHLPPAEGVFIEGRPEPRPGDPIPEVRATTDRYLEALGLPVRQGRFFSRQDGQGAPRVAVLAESVARHYFAQENPVGRRIRLAGGAAPWLTVVGVTGEVRDWFNQAPIPTIYVPSAQWPRTGMQIAMRTAGDPLRAATAARAAVRGVDPELPVYDLLSMEQILDEETSGVRISAGTMMVYAGIALLLAVTGIYGVMAYSVVQRTHEIGIRMALGAGQAEILKLTVGYAVRLAALGLAIGAPAAYGLMLLVSRLLYGVLAVDGLTLAGFTAILGAAALAAGYLPARQASRVDPLSALRVE